MISCPIEKILGLVAGAVKIMDFKQKSLLKALLKDLLPKYIEIHRVKENVKKSRFGASNAL